MNWLANVTRRIQETSALPVHPAAGGQEDDWALSPLCGEGRES